jgi:hypothetical protein
MAGLGLIHLGFLAAALAVAVPIAIHLLLRPRARRVEIGTVRFLMLALRDSTRQRRLRRWLLLALRCAAVLLLALLFARPFLSGAGADGRDREAILLIDQSASMGAVQSGQTRFAKALEAADQILKALPQQTAIQVAYFDQHGVEPAEQGIDRTRQPGYGATGYEQALGWARDRLVLSDRSERTVYLITDLQRPGQRAVPIESLPPDVAVEVIEVGRPLVKNLAVVRAEASETTLRDQQPVVVSSHLRNAGAFPARDVRVQLVLEGAGTKVKQQQTLQLAANSLQEVHFSVPIVKPGLYSGYVEVADPDDFPLDNRRWLAFDARPPDRLLLVDGQPGRTVYTNETYYLEAALRLRLPGKGEPLTPYDPERLSWTEGATLAGLDRYRAVILCNVERLSPADLQSLAAFVSAGGSLLVFTGDRVQAEGYAPLESAGLLPAAIAGPAGPDAFRFSTWDKEHPLLHPLSDPQQGDLRRITFHHLTRLNPLRGAKVLAQTSAGEPLLVECRLGQGKILLFASAADRDWSDWPQSRLYVPLVHQMVGYLTGRLPENGRVQTAATGPGRNNPPGATTDGSSVMVRNLDPATSETERWSADDFRKVYNLPKAGAIRASLAPVPALPESQRPGELWTYVVWILLILLGIEFVIANRTHA